MLMGRSHIATLILPFLPTYEAFDRKGYVYCNPPFIFVKKGKLKNIADERQRQVFIDKYADGNENAIHSQRYKGLEK